MRCSDIAPNQAPTHPEIIQDQIMDDDKFKMELLNRLDKIVSLLSLTCGLCEAALKKSIPEPAVRQVVNAGESEASNDSHRSLMRDEMQDGYDLAIQKWKASKGQEENQNSETAHGIEATPPSSG
jgi:hypothetical protein